MGGNFEFQVQDSFLEYFFFEIWRSKKRISLSGKKPPLFRYLSISCWATIVFEDFFLNDLYTRIFILDSYPIYEIPF